MKKFLPLLCCLPIIILFSACLNNSALPSSSEPSPASSELPPASSQTDLPEESQEPVPDFLDAEQQALYRKAKTAFMEFTLNNTGFGSTDGEAELEQDGMQYYKCNGTITKWADFEAAMLSVFTAEYFEELNDSASYTDGDGVFHKRTIFAQSNGDLYYSGGARGTNIIFVWPEAFELEAQSDNEIRFYVVGTYDDFAYDEDGFVIKGDDGDYKRAGNPIQEKKLLTMKKDANGWKFSKFELAY